MKPIKKQTEEIVATNPGLPKIDGGKRIIVVLSPEQAEAAKKVGDGNLSRGVRVALEMLEKVLK